MLHRNRHLASLTRRTLGRKPNAAFAFPPAGTTPTTIARAFSSSPTLVDQKVIDTTWKGTGQVIFLNSNDSGKVLLASLAIGDPFTASMAALGSFTSSMTAKHVQLDKSTYENGLYSYNGCLVGCAAAVFLAPTSVIGASAITVVGASTSTFVAAGLSPLLTSGMPQWTLAFNLVTLTALLRAAAGTAATGTAEVGSDVAASATEVAATASVSAMDLLLSPLVGLSQIFVVESALSGTGIVLAIAMYSPQLATHALLGSTVGCLTGIAGGAAPEAVAAGLWGYNAALTSMGTAVFFRNTRQAQVLSVTGAGATAVTFGACQAVFTSVPCLTLPFCWVMSGCWFLGKGQGVPGLVLAKNPHSPEKNE